jgi:hypothetical protein
MKRTKQRSIESIALLNLTKGKCFYSPKQDKDITAIASYYEKKVKTERLITVNPQTGETERVVKVTLI